MWRVGFSPRVVLLFGARDDDHRYFAALVCLGDDWSAESVAAAAAQTVDNAVRPLYRAGRPRPAGTGPVAAGRASNPEIAGQLFVSRKTVEYHLHKAFTKLGIAGRLELVKLDLS